MDHIHQHCQICDWLEDKAHGDPRVCPSAPERKSELRRAVCSSLASMTPEVRRQKSQLIIKHVLELEEFKRSRVIMAYVGMEMEVDPWGLVRAAWSQGKVVAMPRIDPPLEEPSLPRVHDRRIVPFELEPQLVDDPQDHQGLRMDVFGIWEPKPGANEVPIGEIGLVIVPCVAFDRQGYRMGKGGGFYDRFLAHAELGVACCGLAFSEQVFASLPRCPYDKPVSLLVTETGTLDFRKK